MRAARAIGETIHLAALGIWAGAVVMTGVTAALVFPTMKGLNPSLPDFARFTGDHWLIAAGKPMNKAFLVSDWIGLACAVVAVVTLLFVLVVVRVRVARPAMVLRSIALVAALGVCIYAIGVLRPRMQSEVTAFWEAAQAGDNGTAGIHQQAFDEMHPTASSLIVAQLVLVLCALGAGGYAALTGEASGGGRTPPAPQEPA